MTPDEAEPSDAPVDGAGDEMFGVTCQLIEARAVLGMTGELDIAGTERAISAARAALEAEPLPASLEIDAGELAFVDSSGIAALLRIREMAGAANVAFAVTEASVPFRRVIELTGLEATFFPPS